MQFIEGGKATIDDIHFDRMTEKDSTLLFINVPRRASVTSFYMSATEVTNAEWKEFYQSKIETIGYNEAETLFYPDMDTWVEGEKGYSFSPAMRNTYFSAEAFDNYPVVGISWEQAQVYCKWKTNQLKELGLKLNTTFRLPTNKEWEYAAKGPEELYLEKDEYGRRLFSSLYPWKDWYFKSGSEYLANFGSITDINGVGLKGYAEDDCLYSCHVGNYPPNSRGLYDMAGNVAEWVEDKGGIPIRYKNKIGVHKISEIDSVITETKEKLNTDELQDVSGYTEYLDQLVHDKKILIKGDTRIVKGGSWDDGPVYLQIGSRQAMDKDHKSSRVGFRIAISYEEELAKYCPKKDWKPE